LVFLFVSFGYIWQHMRILTFLLLITAPFWASPQTAPVKAGYGETVTQTPPAFPGGNDSLRVFIKRNLHYPRQALTDGVRGKVWLNFTVDKNGAIRDSSVLKHVHDEIDREALRILSLMPTWIPATLSGSPVDAPFMLQIEFIPPGQKP
jgi:TonB family protein